ncbi:MAG: ATPase [Bacteroidetes bacterium]|nr:MAG: ATPase [Bacteroidota bacterium]PTM09440.1 MAG: ATPase [Bacteroidota bacterium]
MIDRTLGDRIKTKIGRGKAIMIIGPRQVGKTTLILKYLEGIDYKFFDGDDPVTRSSLDTPNTEQIRTLLENKKVVFIDEAQRINSIGLTMKIIVDQFKDVQLWISGSSSFSLFNELNEPLTGRKWEYEMFPISWEELENYKGYLTAERQLEDRLRFGMYPDVINNPGEEIEVLQNLVNSYLYRDILSYAGIKKPDVLDKLVRALALQVGSEVNYNELSQLIGVDRNTVEKYISVLEKGYVIFRLPSYNRNVRNEIKKGRKIYFYDNGIRNMIIGSMNEVNLRTDIGALWENFLISERIKQNKYKLTLAKSYFWRTTQQQEIDYVEEIGTTLSAYEFKWNPKTKAKISKTFTEQYNAEGIIISRDNFRDFVKI